MDSLDSIKLIDTGLIADRKTSSILKFCKDNSIETVNDFLEFYSKYGVAGKIGLEFAGIKDLLNYKYLNIINNDYIKILNSKLTKIQGTGSINKCYSKSDLDMLRRLGLTLDEIKSFYYFAQDCNSKKIIDIMNKLLNPKSVHLYLGAYLDNLFMEKISLICKYYYLKEERKVKYVKKENDELEDLINKKNKIHEIKYKVIRQQALLKSLEKRIEEKENLLNELIEEKKKILQK